MDAIVHFNPKKDDSHSRRNAHHQFVGPCVTLNPKTQSSTWRLTYFPTHSRRSQSSNISHSREMKSLSFISTRCKKIIGILERTPFIGLLGHTSNWIRRPDHRHEDWNMLQFTSKEANHRISRTFKEINALSTISTFYNLMMIIPERMIITSLVKVIHQIKSEDLIISMRWRSSSLQSRRSEMLNTSILEKWYVSW
jgi:hypothetical protein